MSDAPTLQDYMLPVLNLFADGEEHSYKEIPAHLEGEFTLLQADKPKWARILINGTIGYFVKAVILEKSGNQRFKIGRRKAVLWFSKPWRGAFL